ncbi:PREDICTED: uncharacterized protein LOC105560510 isoform X2 [Vollenhovia emeryi]|uniref:uncharacterized protein LOC105560510 isoform X2 n=1 Tax=Vollenhovia emeryi TaxID=411798 RepID=UPI0005F3DF06|nr:PREDICTED: uncharacterized protein LOC105560510 isoform X2 [Vollenhovia emeryi]
MFPTNEDLKLKWCEAIRKSMYRSAQVCSKHFKAEDYKNCDNVYLIRKRLKPSAVPSVHITPRAKLEPVKSFTSDTEDISTENKNNERLQVDVSSTSASIDDPMSKRTLDAKATVCSTAKQAEGRKIKNCTLKSLNKQRYQNNILGIVRKEDFINENAWLRFQKYIDAINKRHKFMLCKNKKLEHEICFFKELLKLQLSNVEV